MIIADTIAFVILLLGGINWGSIGIFQFDLIAWICDGQSGWISRILYLIVGLSAIWCMFSPRFFPLQNKAKTSKSR